MAGDKKTTTKTTAARASDDFPKVYMRLRTVLDGLEINALRYCLNETKRSIRKQRAKEIEALLMPIIEKIEGLAVPGENRGGCGDGYQNCGGVCVPYQCPASSEQ